MNLPEPSGSSPPLKPPGNITICAFSISSTILSIVSLIACEERLFTTRIDGSAPAFSKALAVSTSQLVPGKVGINTRGLATLFFAINIERSFSSGTSNGIEAFLPESVANTFSSLPDHASISSSTVCTHPSRINTALSLVVPRRTPFSKLFPSASSTTKLPAFAAKRVSSSRPCAKVKPVLLPKAILHTHAAAPPSLTTVAERMLPSRTPS